MRLADVARENDAWVVFNGHADKIAYGGRHVINPATLPSMRDRTIIVGCVSKNYLMPGWRIGWALGPRAMMLAMEDVHIFNGVMPSGICQAGATAALAGDQRWQAEAVETYAHAQAALLEELAASPWLSVVPAEGGLYCLLDTEATGVTGTHFAVGLLTEEQVAVTPMEGWGSDDFGRYLVRLIFTNEPEPRLRDAGQRIVSFAERRRAL